MQLTDSPLAMAQRPPRALPQRSDATVIAASLSAPEAFEELFDRHWPSLHAFCCSRAGAAGEDIAAETFRLAFDKRRRYDSGHPDARPWLFGIATRLLQHHFRDGQRRASALQRVVRTRPPAPAEEGAATRLERQLLGPNLAAAVGELSAPDRDTLLLWAWAELSYEEIARALEVPLGTVRSRLNRARSLVRTHLDLTTVDGEGTDHDDQ